MSADAAMARVEGWLQPVPGGPPAGADARYDPLHEQIRAEAAKLDSPAGGPPDWVKVVRQAEQLTTQKSKDLLIESYAAYALYQVEGLQGLAAGLFLVAESMDRFWDGMQPPAARIRARVNAVQWLTDKLDLTLPAAVVGPGDHGAVQALDAGAKRLRSVIADKFTDSAPAIRPLLDTVERLKMSLPEAPEEASDTEPPPAPVGGAADAAPSPAPAPVHSAAPAAVPAATAAPAAAAEPEADLPGELAAAAAPYCAPIPGDNPAGEDAKYDPDHEELRNIIAMLDSPTGGQIDWKKVAPKAGNILERKSKDLLIAAYFTWSMFELDRLQGLAIGLEVIAQICEQFWEGCYPPAARIRGRANALAWLLDRLETPLPAVSLTAADKHAVELLEVAAKRFALVVRDKFEDAAPPVRPLTENVQRLKMALPAPAPPPAAAPPPPPPPPQAQAPRPQPAAAPAAAAAKPAAVALGDGPAAALADPKEVGKFATAVGKSLLDAAKVLREAAPADPTSYTFMRVGLALGVSLPPAQGTATKVPPPPDQSVKDIEISVNNQAWDQVIAKAELALIGKRFWLDLHRYTALALANLGKSHERAHAAVIAGTALWVKLYPDLVEMTFASGMPFASPITREWIQTEVMPTGGGGGGGDSSEGSEELGKARSLVGGGKMDEALGVLEGLAHGARSGRARFRARLAMAQALTSGPTVNAAEAMFDVLLQEIDATGLDRWEPELAADCYRSHLACLKALKKPNDPAVSQQAALVYRRFCRVDPLGAVKAGG
jgi:type VI secretion system ImpA/VasJ family protein